MQPQLEFLTLENVLRIHEDQVSRYGGSKGVRDLGLLQSALAAPQSGFGEQYFHADLFEMAAAYLFHLAQNHPFMDGNKRTAAVAALAFLKLNGIRPKPGLWLEEVALGTAEGRLAKPAIAEAFRKHSS